MIHTNNCTSDINAWVDLFGKYLKQWELNTIKVNCSPNYLNDALKGDEDLGKLLSYGYISGEFITDVQHGYQCLYDQ